MRRENLMFPVLFEIGPIKIYSYGFMLVVAFYTCYFLLHHDLKRLGHDDKLASDMVFWAAVGGIFGSKIYYLLENLGQVIEDPIGMIFSGSGLVFLGGLMGGTLAVTILLRKNGLPWLKFADIVAPLLILGYGIGRIGCFLVGDDYGIPSNLPWAIAFPNGLPPSTSSVFGLYYPWIDISDFESGLLKVHPTQIYESVTCISLFFFLWFKRSTIKVTGSLFFLYLILAGVERFAVEFIRTNEKYLFDIFSGSQIISIIMIIIGSYFLLYPLSDME
ncbi:MAG: prolipoprotein diacylglyceryl transferase [Candidatus Marinimicrobia bacterium]|nr:prolipoprotein diacylglyceryl transferase [Candidatus Neomarinimicrobiota bacterium]